MTSELRDAAQRYAEAQREEDYGHEPVPGLPERLPQGEQILWQGAPEWRSFALSAFHVVGISIYFGVLAIWKAVVVVQDGQGWVEAAVGAAWLAGLGAFVGGMALGAAWYSARTARYTITNRRVVFRVGMALTVSVNLPFSAIAAANLRRHRDGTGDIALKLVPPARASWVMFFPHCRPWRFGTPEPMLRNIAEPERVAQVLGRALATSADMPAVAVASPAGRAAAPHGEPAVA